MDVGGDGAAGSGVEADEFAELEVFTELDDFGFHEIAHGGFAVRDFEGGGVVGGVRGSEFVGDGVDEGLEVVVFGDEVGLAVDFDEEAGSGVGVEACGDDAFVGFAVGFGTGFGDAAFAEEFDGGFDVAVGLGEDFFAVHHAGVGFVA